MFIRHARAALPGLAIALIPFSGSTAHEIVGNRFFPATLGIDDPGVNDELSLPTVSSFNTGDDPSFRERDFSGEFSKRITEAFAISIGSTYSVFSPPGGPTGIGAHGFQNLETTFKYRVFKDPSHEFVMSVGLNIEWGGTGSDSVGADPFNTYTPSVFFGKGFGDLPDTLSWLRPVAVTGQVGYAIPGRHSTTTFGIDPDTGEPTADTEFHPQVLNWGGTIQYSMPYLKSAVIDLGLPDFFNHLIPLVEARMQTPVANTLTSGTVTTGTINPGVLWVGSTYQLGVEALVPVNRQSGTRVGVIAQLHLYLDDIDPHGIGRPIFGGAMQPASPLRGNDHATLISDLDHRAAVIGDRQSIRPCPSRSCRAARRQQGGKPAARGDALLHPEARTGVQFGHGHRSFRPACRCRKGACERQPDVRHVKRRRCRDLPRQLARVVRGYPQD